MGRRRRTKGIRKSLSINGDERESNGSSRLLLPTPLAWQASISPMSLFDRSSIERMANTPSKAGEHLTELYEKIRQCSLTIMSCVETMESRKPAIDIPESADAAVSPRTQPDALHDKDEMSRMQNFNSASVLGEFILTSHVIADSSSLEISTAASTAMEDTKSNANLVEEHSSVETPSNLQMAINEFVDTEKSYLHKLRQLNKEFVVRLTAYHELDGVASILSPEQIELIFSNVESIVKLHTQIYLDFKMLRNRPKLDVPFLEILDRLASKLLESYTGYAINFACHQNIVSDLTTKNSKFADFVAVSEKCCTGKNVKLSSLRMEPIQRISRYILLVDAIRKNADPGQDPIPLLDGIVQKFRDAAEHIDANMKVAQAKQRVVEIQEIFLENTPDPTLIVSGRYCIRESALQMLSHKKGWTGVMKHIHKTFCFILFNDCLIYCTITSENPRRGRMKGFLDLLSITVEENVLDEKDTSFVISTISDISKSSLFILAKTIQQKKEWLDDLQICIRQRKETQLQPDTFNTELDLSIDQRPPASFSELQMTAVLQLEPLPSPSVAEEHASDIELAKKLTRKASKRQYGK